VSNASDALDKRRFEALTRPDLAIDEGRSKIQIVPDKEARTLRVVDSGIGMSRAEAVDHLGTIARSGTKEFQAALARARAGGAAPDLIGQFGVGFYAAFMVADEVEVLTRRAGEESATLWKSRGEGGFDVEDGAREEPGTTVTLHLKPLDPEEEGARDYTDPWTLREIVELYSDFIAWPIELATRDGKEDKVEVLNSQKPLWTRAKASVGDEEYAQFYRHLTRDWRAPLETIHFKAEGGQEYTALLFLPRERPLEVFDPEAKKSRVKLYVRRVFIMADCEELVPPWLRFVAGVVDSNDLPLNISRETLQHNRAMGQIMKRVVRKVVDTLASLCEKRRADYAAFWRSFGSMIKEGIWYDDGEREELAKVALFESSAGPELTTLAEYVARMPATQAEIYVVLASDRAAAERSPHMEALRKKGCEALFLVDPVDEFVVQKLERFQEKPLRRVDRGEVELDDDSERAERARKEKDLEALLESVRKELHEHVESVRFTSRLTESPACLVAGEHDPSPQMEKLMRAMGREVPQHKRVLELNASHALVATLKEWSETPAEARRFGEACEVLLGQALIAEGSPPVDPARFAKLLGELLLRGA
jgi:molecular chaperone HtpG